MVRWQIGMFAAILDIDLATRRRCLLSRTRTRAFQEGRSPARCENTCSQQTDTGEHLILFDAPAPVLFTTYTVYSRHAGPHGAPVGPSIQAADVQPTLVILFPSGQQHFRTLKLVNKNPVQFMQSLSFQTQLMFLFVQHTIN